MNNFDTIIEYVDKAITKYTRKPFYDDLRNELILRVAEAENTTDCSERTFIDRTIGFGIRDYFRTLRRYSNAEEISNETPENHPLLNDVFPGEDDEIDRAILKMDLADFEKSLPAPLADVFRLFKTHSQSEIAACLGLSDATISRQIEEIRLRAKNI